MTTHEADRRLDWALYTMRRILAKACPAGLTLTEQAAILRSPAYQALSRRKSEQLSRITRMIQRRIS